MAATGTRSDKFALLYGVSWESYEKVLFGFGDHSWRHCYDGGTLSINSSGAYNLRGVLSLRQLVHALTLELDMETQSVGRMTLWSPKLECGIEPDESFYLTNEPLVRCKMDYTPDVDPPPDLTIDGSLADDRLARLKVFAKLGVPEVWSAKDEVVRFLRLTGGEYREIERSVEIPFFTPQIVTERLAAKHSISDTEWIREFLTWVREQGVEPPPSGR